MIRPMTMSKAKYMLRSPAVFIGRARSKGTVLHVPTLAPSSIAMLCGKVSVRLLTSAIARSVTGVLPCSSIAPTIPKRKPRYGEVVKVPRRA